jgi:predicted AlkP superfamily pyrophosphatase or phosphodiesterase
MQPIVLLNAVGLTPRLLPFAPRLQALAQKQWLRPLREVLPAVTCTAQATLLTGEPVSGHGVVANGWLFRDTQEVRFWQQSNRLIQAEPVYETARKIAVERNKPFKSAKLFWWFNQGAAVDISVTPKPWYGIDGSKVFGISGTPFTWPDVLERELGAFPFPAFWGPMSGIASTDWIARATAWTLKLEKPTLTLAYLPHLDYEPQRTGPSGCDMPKLVRELDDACAPILDEAEKMGAEVWVVSEYGHCDVTTPVYPNKALAQAGLLRVRPGPFGDQLDIFGSRAFALCDHQLAHVYVRQFTDQQRVRETLAALPGVDKVLDRKEQEPYQLSHSRGGELVLLAQPDAWFAYPFWLDEKRAPDYARSVAIHHKPGFDPCELFFDPRLKFPKLHVVRRLIQKKLGFRMKMDVVPTDASIVRGSHGLRASSPMDQPLLIGSGKAPAQDLLPMTAVKQLLLNQLGLGEKTS